MTLDQALARVEELLDGLINDRLAAIEAEMRRNAALTGPEAEDALDQPPVPNSAWRRITIEECMEREWERVRAWRAEVLTEVQANMRRQYAEEGPFDSISLECVAKADNVTATDA